MAEITLPRGRKACSYCHAKKTRCVFEGDNTSCRACKGAKIGCIPRNRKKRQTIAERQPSSGNMIATQHALLSRELGRSPATNIDSHHTPEIPLDASDPGETLGQDHQLPGSVNHTYMGRAHYIRAEEEINEISARSFPATRPNGLSHLDMSTIAAYDGFQIPPVELRQEYITTFLRYCFPWMPVLHGGDINDITRAKSSPLLSQSLYVAASRVIPPNLPDSPSTEDYYQRAKTLFWMGHENSPIVAIKACLMMQWYNPEGPEHVSLDTSEFWLRTGVGLAYQVGLHKEPLPGPFCTIRRRLWWSLVARDCLIAASHGRPRAINLKDCEVLPPKPSDIHVNEGDGVFFVQYIQICRILGDLTESCCRNHLPETKRFETENYLIRWIEEMPDRLRLSQSPQENDFDSRQLHLPYLMGIMILSRFHAQGVSRTAILAASTCAGIYEGFLLRDELKFLAPVFTIYCIGAGFSLLTLYPNPDLWSAAQLDLTIILNCLSELSKRWRSAIGGLKAVKSALLKKQRAGQTNPNLPLETDDPDKYNLFRHFPAQICRLRSPYDAYLAANAEVVNTPSCARPIFNTHHDRNSVSEESPFSYQQIQQPALSPAAAGWMEEFPMDSSAYEHFGNWLLNEPSIAALGGA